MADWLSIAGTLINLIIAGGTITLWLEARRQRRALQKPVLVPCKLTSAPDQPGALFCWNFSYPVDDDFKERGLLHLGIKNVGPGLACDASVEAFWSDDQRYSGGAGFAQIAPGQVTALVIRFGYKEWDDIEYKPYNVLVRYADIFGDTHYLQLQLWFSLLDKKKSAEAKVIDYSYSAVPIGVPPLPIFRWVEGTGHFEVEEVLSNVGKKKRPPVQGRK